MFGTSELIIVLIIVLVLFGGNKIPQLFAGLGKGIRSFRKGLNEEETPPKIGSSKEAESAENKD